MDDRGPVILTSNSPRAIEWTVDELLGGSLVIIPTDTVYGLAALLHDAEAVNRMYEVKGRPEANPIPILVASSEHLSHVTRNVDPDIMFLLDECWPGPLTVVLPARAGLPVGVVAADGTVGVRMPNHPLALEVITKAGGLIACTSANRSGEEPATTAAEAAKALPNGVSVVLDGGKTPGSMASTVIRIDNGELTILRQGRFDETTLRSAWDRIRFGH